MRARGTRRRFRAGWRSSRGRSWSRLCQLRQIDWMITHCCRAAGGSPYSRMHRRMHHENLPGWAIRPTPASLSPVWWRPVRWRPVRWTTAPARACSRPGRTSTYWPRFCGDSGVWPDARVGPRVTRRRPCHISGLPNVPGRKAFARIASNSCGAAAFICLAGSRRPFFGKIPGDYLTFRSARRYCVTDRSLRVLAGMRDYDPPGPLPGLLGPFRYQRERPYCGSSR